MTQEPVPPGEDFEWAEDPVDERLTVAGAKYDAESRLMLVFYNDLKGRSSRFQVIENSLLIQLESQKKNKKNWGFSSGSQKKWEIVL